MIFDDFRNVLGVGPGGGEVFYHRIIRDKLEQPWSEVWPEIRARNTVKGWFVEKVMFHYTPKISHFIGHGTTAGVKDAARFEPRLFDHFYRFFAKGVWVYVERRDVYAQAVSMYLAEETGLWVRRRGRTENNVERKTPAYNFGRLSAFLRNFALERDAWQAFFRHYGIEPIRIYYEDAVDDYPEYLNELLEAAGLRMIENVPERRITKIGAETSIGFAQLLRNDIIARQQAEQLKERSSGEVKF